MLHLSFVGLWLAKIPIPLCQIGALETLTRGSRKLIVICVIVAVLVVVELHIANAFCRIDLHI